jgi:hypothetical protein
MDELGTPEEYVLQRRKLGIKVFKAMKWIGPWILFLGVWPFADPGHGSLHFIVLIDLMFHLIGLFFTGLLVLHMMGAIEVSLKFKFIEKK